MKLKRFLESGSEKEELVDFENHQIIMQYQKNVKGFKIIIEITNDYCYNNLGWSKLRFRQHYESEKFALFIKICDKINKYLKVSFCSFPDNIKLEDYKLSTLNLFIDFPHPIEVFGFQANQPYFPFTRNKDLIASNLYYFEQFMYRIRNIFGYMTIKKFVDLVKLKCDRDYDFIKILENDYAHLESKLEELVKLCRPDENNIDFCRRFVPLLQKCLEKIKFLPNEYIKLY